MNLHWMLQARAERGEPVRVGLIGAGRFGTMYLAQARRTPGVHVLGVVDQTAARAREACRRADWPDEQIAAASPAAALATGRTWIGEDAHALIEAGGLEIVIEATGDPAAGIRHCLRAIEHGRHILMVTVEADVVAGPLLAQGAKAAGLIYSLAYGDQPALIVEHVDWARTCGFEVVAAGKGTRYLPHFHASTPETVWEHYDITPELAARGGMNPKVYNSFIDGTKSSIEMSAVCNATGLDSQEGGLGFPPAACEELAEVCKPRPAGGTLAASGVTEVVSSLRRDGTAIANHLRMGTFVVVAAGSRYVRNCIEERNFLPDSTYEYSALYRPTHLIGFELGVSVASVALRGEPTGVPREFRSDVVAIAKRDLAAGEVLDGEGGSCVWGRQMPAARSLELGGLPLGLASGVPLTRGRKAGEPLLWGDVRLDEHDLTLRTRRAMEQAFGPQGAAASNESP
jgi:predicted homoserine dehydrogenase-like protein